MTKFTGTTFYDGIDTEYVQSQRPSQRIKQVAPPVPVPALPIHDKDGHFIVRIGDVLLNRCES
jgi:hypothetical protein